MWSPPYTHGGQESVTQSIKLLLAAFSSPASVLNHFSRQCPPHNLLTYPFSLQSSRKGCWTDALPQDPIQLWWKVAEAA